MIETAYEPFLSSTRGRYTVLSTSFVWCASPTLCGAFLWGEQSVEETRAILHIFDQYPRQMGPTFDMVLDTRGVQSVRPEALSELFSWLLANRTEMRRHLRVQANVIREGPIGFLLTGLLPVAQWTLPYQLHYEPEAAYRALVGMAGVPLAAEVESIADRVRGVPRELRVAREMIERNLDVAIADVGRALGVSARSLQRVLNRHGTSFHDEVVSARLARAQTLLRSGDDKVSAVASRVGISERALTALFRKRTGLSPAEWRKQRVE
jgi:AraC-like DNA-binding protein